MKAPRVTLWKYFIRTAEGDFQWFYKDRSKERSFLELVESHLFHDGYVMTIHDIKKEFEIFMKTEPEKESLIGMYNKVKNL
jgi:hypothetical protein